MMYKESEGQYISYKLFVVLFWRSLVCCHYLTNLSILDILEDGPLLINIFHMEIRHINIFLWLEHCTPRTGEMSVGWTRRDKKRQIFHFLLLTDKGRTSKWNQFKTREQEGGPIRLVDLLMVPYRDLGLWLKLRWSCAKITFRRVAVPTASNVGLHTALKSFYKTLSWMATLEQKIVRLSMSTVSAVMGTGATLNTTTEHSMTSTEMPLQTIITCWRGTHNSSHA